MHISTADTHQLNVWNLYHKNQVQKIIDEKDSLLYTPPDQPALWCNTERELYERGAFENSDYVEVFSRSIKNPYIGDEWLKTALEVNQIFLPCPFTGGTASCKESFYQGINYLRFVGQNDEVFWVFQSITSFDLVYFPLRKVFLVGKHPPHNDVEKYSKNFEKNIDKLTELWRNSAAPEFSGIIVSHFYPFHFYSEAVPAIERISDKKLLEKIPVLYARKGGCFFEPHHIWPEIKKELHLSGSEMDTIPNARGKFSILFGTAMNYQDEEQTKYMRKAYAKITDKYTSKFPLSYIYPKFLNLRTVCDPLIWIGLQATKRSWIEQVEGISQLIFSILKKYPRAGFVFDGWTSPLYERKADEEPIKADLNILLEILKNTGDINYLSLIGAKSSEKTAIAQSICAFVTNFGTGSLHVARFARKHGVGHINTTFPKGMHVHYNTICLSDGHVQDNQTESGKRADSISYSLDWKIIDSKLHEIIKKQIEKY